MCLPALWKGSSWCWTPARRVRLHLEPGYGIAVSGEDVALPAPVSYTLDALPVYAPARILQPLEGGAEVPADAEETAGLSARRFSQMTLGEVRQALGDTPSTRAFEAGILVAQPTTFIQLGETLEVCDDDESARAYEDELRVDACRLVFYAWPVEWLPLPARSPQWRNLLAYAIFDRERSLPPGEVLPWNELGVPLALIAMDDAGDRCSWTEPPLCAPGASRVLHTPSAGLDTVTAFLAQARMEQLGEHLADPSLAGASIDAIAGAFRFLPPAGLLPKDAIDLMQRTSGFLPDSYRVTALPAPLEQLDVALEASAGLEPFDTLTRDDLELIVPVPQAFYEPRLLQSESVGPEFRTAIDRFVQLRGKWRVRREDVRTKASAIERAIRAEDRAWPDPDPGQIDPKEEAGDTQIDTDDRRLAEPEAAFGTSPSEAGPTVDAFEQLQRRLADSPVRHLAAQPLASLPQNLTLPATIAISHEQGQISFRGRMTEPQRDTLTALSTNAAYRTAITGLFERSQRDDLSKLPELGVEGFIAYLEAKIKRSDDTLDLGFLNVQTDIYRVRQLVLGSEEATRLATSPALASIAQGVSASATREDLARFFEAAEARSATPAPTPSTPAAPPAAPTAPTGTTGTGSIRDLAVTRLSSSAFTRAASPLRDVVEQPREDVTRTPIEAATRVPVSEVDVRGQAQPLFRPEVSKDVIAGQAAITGETYDFRSVTIAERLATPAAPAAKSHAVSTKFEVVSGVTGLDIAIDDLAVPGFKDTQGNDVRVALGDVIRGNLAGELLSGDKHHDPDPDDSSEASFFSAGVRALENSISTLRVVEGRVEEYKRALALCRTTLVTLKDLAAQADRRLDVLEDDLAEVRHDVSVAQALLEEEQRRVETINARRKRVLAEHVTFLAYRRPRTVSLRVDMPSKAIIPGEAAAPVPACINEDLTPPTDLSTMLDLLKQAPVAWFKYASLALTGLKRPDDLKLSLATAKSRAQAILATSIAVAPKPTAGVQALALTKVFTAQAEAMQPFKLARSTIDLSRVTAASWVNTNDQAKEALSLGDLIDSSNIGTARRATKELYDIGQVATCFYRAMTDVPAALRLEWATRLSQYDTPVSLRELTSLPRWGEIDLAERREAQALVDWLYSRVDTNRAAAVALMDDLVRVCILLASHAPINQIITGRLPKPVAVSPGVRFDITVLPEYVSKVRIGMSALVYTEANVAAVAVVRDISGDQVSGEVLQTHAPTVQLAQGASVHFTDEPMVGTYGFAAMGANFR